jgi:hypothetical protein
MGFPTEGGYLGFQKSNTAATNYGAFAFMIRTILARVHTSTLVKVMSVTNDGGVSAVGFVDVQPLVNQSDGAGVAMPHGTVYKCPYQRMQGGGNAIILDPQVGDIGVAVFAERDISSVVANKGKANPGSKRCFDMADAIYLGGLLNGVPTQYVRFSEDGITISSSTAVILAAPDVQINCARLEIAATTSASVTTPTWTVNGDHVVTGLMTTGTLSSGNATFTAAVEIDGKNLGAGHTHNLTGGGHTLDVT